MIFFFLGIQQDSSGPKIDEIKLLYMIMMTTSKVIINDDDASLGIWVLYNNVVKSTWTIQSWSMAPLTSWWVVVLFACFGYVMACMSLNNNVVNSIWTMQRFHWRGISLQNIIICHNRCHEDAKRMYLKTWFPRYGLVHSWIHQDLWFKNITEFFSILTYKTRSLLYELDKNTSNLKMLKSKAYILTYLLCLGSTWVVTVECVWPSNFTKQQETTTKKNKPRRVLFSNTPRLLLSLAIIIWWCWEC